MSLKAINSADFLTENQIRDILYNNAARFFRFTEEMKKAHLNGVDQHAINN